MKKMKAEIKRNVNRRSLLVAKEEDLIKNLKSENHRMEELLFHQKKRKVDAGSRLVHYLHFYKMV